MTEHEFFCDFDVDLSVLNEAERLKIEVKKLNEMIDMQTRTMQGLADCLVKAREVIRELKSAQKKGEK